METDARKEILDKIYRAELEEARQKCLKETAILELEKLDNASSWDDEKHKDWIRREREVAEAYSKDAYTKWVDQSRDAEIPGFSPKPRTSKHLTSFN